MGFQGIQLFADLSFKSAKLMAGLQLWRGEDGGIKANEVEEANDWQAYGSYKAERLLHFSARSFALAEWGQLEAFVEFFECLLEEFWAAPPEGFVGPTVGDLRKCETAALKHAVRLMLSSSCSMEDALQTTVTETYFQVFSSCC